MSYKLSITTRPPEPDWIAVKTYFAAQDIVLREGIPSFVLLDSFESTEESTIQDFVKWLVSQVVLTQERFPKGFDFSGIDGSNKESIVYLQKARAYIGEKDFQ